METLFLHCNLPRIPIGIHRPFSPVNHCNETWHKPGTAAAMISAIASSLSVLIMYGNGNMFSEQAGHIVYHLLPGIS